MWKHTLCLILLLLGSRVAFANPQRGLPPPPADLDRSSPAKTVELFQLATERGQFARAAFALDLRRVPQAEQASRGPELARQLRFVLDRVLPLDVSRFSGEEDGSLDASARKETLGEVHLDELTVPVELQRVSDGQGGSVWLFTANTVAAVPSLYERIGPGWLGSHAPAWSYRLSFMGLALWQLLSLLAVACSALLLSWIVTRIALAVAVRIVRQTANRWDDAVAPSLRGPVTFLLAIILADLALPLVRLTTLAETRVAKVVQFLAILAMTWAAVRGIRAFSRVALSNVEVEHTEDDDVLRHGKQARIRLTQQIAVFVACFVGLALGLTQFESVRQIGVSLLASAGVVGVVVGIAAQKSVANLLAGIQISWAQPIRLGDRVKILDDVGWIEEVTFTYVSMKTWDGRRRIFPITYFTENHFENWSRTSQSKVATVTVHADYALPLEPLRNEVRSWLEADPDWDKDEFGLVVIDTTDIAIVLRLTASAPDAGRAFDLACRMRERLVSYLLALDEGKYLPRRRSSDVTAPATP